MLKRIAFFLLASLVQAAGNCDYYVDDGAGSFSAYLNKDVNELQDFTFGSSSSSDDCEFVKVMQILLDRTVDCSSGLYVVDVGPNISYVKKEYVYSGSLSVQEQTEYRRVSNIKISKNITCSNSEDFEIIAEHAHRLKCPFFRHDSTQCSSPSYKSTDESDKKCCEQCANDEKCVYYHLNIKNGKTQCEFFDTCATDGRRHDEEDDAPTFVHKGTKKSSPTNWTLVVTLIVVVSVAVLSGIICWCRRYVEVSVEAAA